MNRYRSLAAAVAVVLAQVGVLLPAGGCGDIWKNLTKEKTGDIGVTFINNTNFRASFSYGSYDEWDRNPPGDIVFQQTSVEAGDRGDRTTITCNRDFAIGTQGLLDRGLLRNVDEQATFDPDRFVTVVNFSSAPGGTDAEHLPTEGTADGLHLRLGLDFSCADDVLIYFEADPDAPGGFRIDYVVVRDAVPE